jgi:PAS domain S-box-containing protein
MEIEGWSSGGSELVSAIVDSASDAVIAKTLDGVILAWNPGAERLYGYTAEEAVGRSISLIVPETHLAQLETILAALRRGDRVDYLETMRRRKDGRLLDVGLTVSPVHDPDGNLIGASAIGRDITAQRAAARALADSEQRFRRLVENAQDVVLRFRVAEPRGYEYVSPAVSRMLGWDPQDFYRYEDIAIELVHPDDRERLLKVYEERIETPFLMRALRRDGSTAWIERTQVVVTDEHDVPVAVEAIVRDVTATRATVESLRKSERELRAVFESSRDAMLIADDDRVYVKANAAAALLYGVPISEIVGRRIDDFADGGDPAAVQAAWDDFVAHGSQVGEYTIRRPDGEERVVEFAATAAVEPGRHLSILRDVTDRRRAERALNETRTLYELVAEHTRDLVSLAELDGTILYASPSHERTLRMSPRKLLGRNLAEFVAPEDHSRLDAATAAARRGLPTDGILVRLVCDNGREVYAEGSVTPIPDERGRPHKLLITSRDIGSRLHAERLEERLRGAERLESIGRLAGGIAHDFNNLLTAINGYAESALLDLPPEAERVRSSLEEVRNAGWRAAELTAQLLAFARQRPVQPVPTDASASLRASESMLRRVLGEHIAIEVEAAPGLPAALVDPGQLAQVVLNLAVNARDAMPAGGTVRLRTGEVGLGDLHAAELGLAPGRYVTLTVSDTGEGIDAELQKRMFEPFVTTKDPGEGTGLGLSTVHGIVTQSRGAISCASEAGVGTTFRVYLPATDEEPASPDRPATVREAAPRRDARVLVLDDDETIRQVVEMMLGDAGYDVVVTETAADALAVLDRERIDLLVTDVVMPDMSGPELVDRVRECGHGLPVVFTSGYTRDAAVPEADGQSVAFLQKPFTHAQLDECVRTLLDARAT